MIVDLNLGDVNNFLCGNQSGSTRARYTNARFAQCELRGVADNEFDEGDEPLDDDRFAISPDEFYNLVKKAFGWTL